MTTPAPTRRISRFACLAVVAGAGSVFGAVGVAHAAPADPAVPTGGLQLAGPGSEPSVSSDGRRVVYVAASQWTFDAEGAAMDSVWLLDRTAGVTSELTIPIDGTRPGRSRHPVVSGDGCSVAVVTESAYDLFRDDDRGDRWDVYRTILPGCAGAFELGEWELVSIVDTVDSTGAPTVSASDRADPSDTPSLNESGDVVAFTMAAAAGSGGQPRPWSAVVVADLTVPLGQPGRLTPVPGLPVDAPAAALTVVGQRQPAVSGDGRFVAFATDTVPTATEDLGTGEVAFPASWTALSTPAASPEELPVAVTQVYVWNREPNDADESASAWFRLASAGPAGQPGAASSTAPAISDHGEVVAFTSSAPDLLPAALEPTFAGITQIYRWDATATELPITLVTQVAGVPGDGASSAPDLDATGRLVAFETQATSLLAPPATASMSSEGADLLLADARTGAFQRLTVRPDGQPAVRSARRPAMSATGRVIAFESLDPVALGVPAPTGAPAESGSTTLEGGWQLLVDEFPTELASSDLDLGTTAPGAVSSTWYTTIVNHGRAAFLPDSIVTTDPAFQIVGGTCLPDLAVMPGESCTVEVAFAPSIDGPASADVVVAEAGADPVTVSVGVVATAGVPSLAMSPTSNDFGSPLVGLSSSPALVTVVNTALVPVTVFGLAVGGDHPGDFSVAYDLCTGAVLAPGTVCELAVNFLPTAEGPRSATLTAIGNDGATASAVLGGSGVYAPLVGVAQTTAPSGGHVDIDGLGFPANSFLSVSWAGSSSSTVLATDATGEFSERLAVPRTLTPGQHHLLVVDPAQRFEPVATADLLVTRTPRSGGASPALRPTG
jgi:hypothetical protein